MPNVTHILLVLASGGRQPSSATAPPKGLGMQLGKTQRTNKFLESLKAKGEVIVEDVLPKAGPARSRPCDFDHSLAALKILTLGLLIDFNTRPTCSTF